MAVSDFLSSSREQILGIKMKSLHCHEGEGELLKYALDQTQPRYDAVSYFSYEKLP